MPDVDLDALGAQYREARDSIAVHRVRQARAEVAYHDAYVRHHGDLGAADVVTARAVVDQAVADVEWCKAVAVAAGEEFKGVRFEDVVARNDDNRVEHGHAALKDMAVRRIAEANG